MNCDVLDEPLKKFIHKNVIMLDIDQTIEEAARTMRDEQIGSIIVSEKGEPVGIMTERDILYKVVAGGKNPSELKIKEIVSKPLIFIDSNTKVKDAIALMVKKNIRRLVVRDGKNLSGVISQRSVIGDIHKADVSIAEIDLPKGVSCPYCRSVFESKEELSKHLDRIHIGYGLLEGIR